MRGAIANLLKDDQQIGGLLDWDLQIIRGDGSDGVNRTSKVLGWKGEAQKYWYYEDVEMPVTVIFYKFENGELYQVDRKVCQLELKGDKDTVISDKIELWTAS